MAKSDRQRDTSRTKPVQPSNRATRAAEVKAQSQRRQMLTWLGGGLLIALIAVVALIIIDRQEDDPSLAGGPSNVATVVPGPAIESSIVQDGMVLGDANAPILVVEYGDYQCPFCTKFARESMPLLIQDFIATGQIRFEFHEFPIIGSTTDGFDQEGESFLAAEAAACANDQGMYWTYHDLLYANSLGEHKDSFTPDRLKLIATQAPGLEVETFNSCLDSRTHRDDVQAMGDSAIANGINSTPTFIVNGQPVTGADYDELKAVIESQIAGP